MKKIVFFNQKQYKIAYLFKITQILVFFFLVSNAISQNKENIVKDADGNIYNTVTIGTQTWMKENLKTTRYSNGDKIGTIKIDTFDLRKLKSPKLQFAYDGDEKNVAVYGRLYTWYAATDPRNICPTGWHVPTDMEFCMLENAVEPGSDTDCNLSEHRGNNQGGYMKVPDTTKFWRGPNTGADNRSGFSVIPSGILYFNGVSHCMGSHCYFWTASEHEKNLGKSRRFYYDSKDVSRSGYHKESCLSIRCVKDN